MLESLSPPHSPPRVSVAVSPSRVPASLREERQVSFPSREFPGRGWWSWLTPQARTRDIKTLPALPSRGPGLPVLSWLLEVTPQGNQGSEGWSLQGLEKRALRPPPASSRTRCSPSPHHPLCLGAPGSRNPFAGQPLFLSSPWSLPWGGVLGSQSPGHWIPLGEMALLLSLKRRGPLDARSHQETGHPPHHLWSP